MLTCDDYITPASLNEAFAAMEAHRGHFRIVAGATDTLPWAREGRAGDVHIPALIDITKIPELREVSRRSVTAVRWSSRWCAWRPFSSLTTTDAKSRTCDWLLRASGQSPCVLSRLRLFCAMGRSTWSGSNKPPTCRCRSSLRARVR